MSTNKNRTADLGDPQPTEPPREALPVLDAGPRDAITMLVCWPMWLGQWWFGLVCSCCGTQSRSESTIRVHTRSHSSSCSWLLLVPPQDVMRKAVGRYGQAAGKEHSLGPAVRTPRHRSWQSSPKLANGPSKIPSLPPSPADIYGLSRLLPHGTLSTITLSNASSAFRAQCRRHADLAPMRAVSLPAPTCRTRSVDVGSGPLQCTGPRTRQWNGRRPSQLEMTRRLLGGQGGVFGMRRLELLVAVPGGIRRCGSSMASPPSPTKGSHQQPAPPQYWPRVHGCFTDTRQSARPTGDGGTG